MAAGTKSSPKGERNYLGLKKLITGRPQTKTQPTPGSKTQERKKNKGK